MNPWIEQIATFHEAFGAPIGLTERGRLGEVGLKDIKLRKELIKEEVTELLEAIDSDDLAHILKETCDVLYVVIGTTITYGLHTRLDRAMLEVTRSNMSKLGADGQPMRRIDGKIIKGPNYSEADMESIINS